MTEDIDAVLATYGKTIQPSDLRRKRNPSRGLITAYSRHLQRQAQRAMWEAERDVSASLVLEHMDEQVTQEIISELERRE